MDDELSTICALLHDVVEDTPLTLEDLSERGFPPEAIEALKLLTHDDSVPYREYVEKIAENPTAKKVKIADLRHNSDLTRFDFVDEKTRERCKKYQQALALLLK